MADNFKTKAYIIQTKNNELLTKCTSGGVFTTLALQFLKNDGFVCGAVYGNDFEVKHVVTNNITDVEKFAGSKYVQSHMGNIFTEIKMLLTDGKRVLFCGTPCQVAGLKSFLELTKTNIDGLFLVDLVCHGVPSPRLWELYVEYTIKKRGPLKCVNFRSKYLGYHTSVMEEINADGKRYVGSARTHLMSKIFFRNIADRQSCYECSFKTVKRDSNLTLFDCWHAGELVKEIDDRDDGYTTVIVQDSKGEEIISNSSNLFNVYPCNLDDSIQLDGIMAINSVKRHPMRLEFYPYLFTNGIEKTIDKYLPISKKDYVIESIKVFMKRNKITRKILEWVK